MSFVMKSFNFITYFTSLRNKHLKVAYVTFRREKSMESANSAFHPFSFQAALLLIFPSFDPVFPSKTQHTTSCCGFLCGYEAHLKLHNDSTKSFAIFPSKNVPRGLNPTFSLDANLCPFLFPFLL